jgi:hypothetical protein
MDQQFMKRGNASQALALASLMIVPSLPLMAADPGIKLEPPVEPNKNRFGIGYRGGFNFTALFKNVGNNGRRNAAPNPGPDAGGANHYYDDGYNLVDVRDNDFGVTWNWGYKNASQLPGNDTIEMHRTTPTSTDSTTHDDDAQHGFELTWDRELGRVKDGKWAWGLQGAFGWTDIEIKDERNLSTGVRTVTDIYDLGGVNPNVPPFSTEYPGHAGNYEGPGPLIDDTPDRSITRDSVGSTVRGTRDFDGDLFSFRAGPYIDIPLDDRWTIALSAGFAVGVVEGEYQFTQLVTTPVGTQRQSGRGRETEVMFGGYLSGTIHCKIDEHWGLFINGQYLGLAGDYEAKARNQKIELDMARTAFFSAGVTFSF